MTENFQLPDEDELLMSLFAQEADAGSTSTNQPLPVPETGLCQQPAQPRQVDRHDQPNNNRYGRDRNQYVPQPLVMKPPTLTHASTNIVAELGYSVSDVSPIDLYNHELIDSFSSTKYGASCGRSAAAGSLSGSGGSNSFINDAAAAASERFAAIDPTTDISIRSGANGVNGMSQGHHHQVHGSLRGSGASSSQGGTAYPLPARSGSSSNPLNTRSDFGFDPSSFGSMSAAETFINASVADTVARLNDSGSGFNMDPPSGLSQPETFLDSYSEQSHQSRNSRGSSNMATGPGMDVLSPLPSFTRGPPPSPGGSVMTESPTVLGRDIARLYPNDRNFVSGCGNYDALGFNDEFKSFAKVHFRTLLLEDTKYREDLERTNVCKVRDEVPKIVEAAQKFAATQAAPDGSNYVPMYRFWSSINVKSGTTGGGMSDTGSMCSGTTTGTSGKKKTILKKDEWPHYHYKEVTTDLQILKERLESPLKTILKNLLKKLRDAGTIPEIAIAVARVPNQQEHLANGDRKRRAKPSIPTEGVQQWPDNESQDLYNRQQRLLHKDDGQRNPLSLPSLPPTQPQEWGATAVPSQQSNQLHAASNPPPDYSFTSRVQDQRRPIKTNFETITNILSSSSLFHQQGLVQEEEALLMNILSAISNNRSNDGPVYVASLMEPTELVDLSTVGSGCSVPLLSTSVAVKVANIWLQNCANAGVSCCSYWVDASDQASMAASLQCATSLLQGHAAVVGNRACSNGSSQNKRGRADVVDAAVEFSAALQEQHLSNPSFQCILVYVNVPDPGVLQSWFTSTISSQSSCSTSGLCGILMSTRHPLYTEGLQLQCLFASIPFVVHDSKRVETNNYAAIAAPQPASSAATTPAAEEQLLPSSIASELPSFWWRRLPQSNLPPLFDFDDDDSDEEDAVQSKLARKMRRDGRIVLLTKSTNEGRSTNVVANRFARDWQKKESSNNRFSLWLSSLAEHDLRQSYFSAIQLITHAEDSTMAQQYSSYGAGSSPDVSLQDCANELMSLLMHMREQSPSFEWSMIFANLPPNAMFEEWFFSASSNWWNSRGRFLLTSPASDSAPVPANPYHVHFMGNDNAESLEVVPHFPVK